jgi:hypothetical protein
MSYEKMRKWNQKNKKGISYKKGYMGFNITGITSEEISNREKQFVLEMKEKTLKERQNYWNNIKEITKNYHYSWEWDWCAFQRNFVFQGKIS